MRGSPYCEEPAWSRRSGRWNCVGQAMSLPIFINPLAPFPCPRPPSLCLSLREYVAWLLRIAENVVRVDHGTPACAHVISSFWRADEENRAQEGVGHHLSRPHVREANMHTGRTARRITGVRILCPLLADARKSDRETISAAIHAWPPCASRSTGKVLAGMASFVIVGSARSIVEYFLDLAV